MQRSGGGGVEVGHGATVDDAPYGGIPPGLGSVRRSVTRVSQCGRPFGRGRLGSPP
ncbi:hypothetical protein KCH_22330 [Kitasatospora cheerisanensis KCTC 2395]|uniref:Uncharacterized protein n=1 Tax=Kitasatospora cheerisanensis KCTC 2395 TaxID=1348663 RepID=A0A066Z7V8_9ACTN|nr:hypothetical protein KCH_22330 [Kitasatospora cheerisanensis KCTC 2395]